MKPPRFPLDPDSIGKQSWDMVIMMLLLFTTFAVPYLLAFGDEIDPTKPLDGYQIWDLLLDVFFCTDIVLSFCTSFVLKGVYVTDMTVIAKYYLCGWFLIDMPGSIPFDKIIIYTSLSSDMGPTLKALKFIRILKMVRAVRFLRKLDQLEQRDTTGSLQTIIKIFRSIFIMVFLAHFLGCMFVLLRSIQLEANPDDLNNWMDAYDPDLRNADKIEQYFACFYWALATVTTIGLSLPPISTLGYFYLLD
jgi:hypothetical protein